MLRAPSFWSHGRNDWLGAVLSPLAAVTAAATARRVARQGWRAPVPVICCGNVTVGGAGKTTVALDLGRRLVRAGHSVHFLLRGYGGSLRRTHRVRPSDSVSVTGDEALLLSEVAPTWIGADRAESARAAIEAGAEVLVMDDGLQNPTLRKNLSLLVVDGAYGFGNGRVMPAGPLREPILAAAARSGAAVLIGEACSAVQSALPGNLPVLRARLVPDAEARSLAGKRVLAFAGIGLPGKFFATVAELGAISVRQHAFSDHHPYKHKDLERLLDEARRLDAIPLTTAKDIVRIPSGLRRAIRVLRIETEWQDEAALDALLARAVQRLS
jgi:tetraacyldisaccharide 4'-kinase